ncbi:aldehyde dehydrogenase family protein [Jatrophihabitans cynanchi]|uniref:Aldehyde dehydrogenase family protein n=1 Tax=Jatrophihabitans cynanchi TaxID=2944128 RepID=A0ABY7K491_9ACTN|nr:aldehyde dehydrogenase family protein [Jatrophihabitans sp. SB3-54]WAX58447.1 aldehyde dehydrogenase family protein [Jatrophihabitans sp. SB3-54]
MKTITHRIGTRAEAGAAPDEMDDLDPSDQRRVLARYAPLSAAQARELVDIVAESSRWRRTPAIERGAVLLRAAAILRERKEQFAEIIASENGKVLREARVEVEKSADFFEFYGALARSAQGTLLADARPNSHARVLTEPIGLVLAICPWNDPLLTPARKLAPALAAANQVLLKPARDTPLAALILEDVLRDAGLPDDALGVLVCTPSILDETVLDDRRLAGVTFTGSNAVGNALRSRLAPRNVRLQTEMGGKNAAIVADDADIDLAVEAILGAAFGQAGQRCTATSRLIACAGVHDRLIDELARRVTKIAVGPSLDPATAMGPLVTLDHRASVQGQVHCAIDAGAELLAGGSVPDKPNLAHGCFFAPTLLAGVGPGTALWQEEVFGPVLAAWRAESVDEAIALANASAYGLSASVFTTSLATAERAIAEVDTGQIAVNLPTSGWDVHHPFGGFRDSGSAFKEQGVQGLQFYTRVKTAAVRFG